MYRTGRTAVSAWSMVPLLSGASRPRRPVRSHRPASTPVRSSDSTGDPCSASSGSAYCGLSHAMLCSSVNARSPVTLPSANLRTRSNIASAVAIVGNAKYSPLAPEARAITEAACSAASVLPSPVGAVTSSSPAPDTSSGRWAAMSACSPFGGNGNRSSNDRSTNSARPSPACRTNTGADATAAP